MQTLGYSLLVLLPLAVGLAVLIFGNRWQQGQWAAERAWREHMHQRDTARLSCWCEHCDMAAHGNMRTRMSVCPDCGDKRCGRAAHHSLACGKPPNVGDERTTTARPNDGK